MSCTSFLLFPATTYRMSFTVSDRRWKGRGPEKGHGRRYFKGLECLQRSFREFLPWVLISLWFCSVFVKKTLGSEERQWVWGTGQSRGHWIDSLELIFLLLQVRMRVLMDFTTGWLCGLGLSHSTSWSLSFLICISKDPAAWVLLQVWPISITQCLMKMWLLALAADPLMAGMGPEDLCV